MHYAIRNICYSCDWCNKIAPSNSNEQTIITKRPKYPFQYIFADYFELQAQHYLSVIDIYSGWIMLYHYPPSKFRNDSLINIFREIFTNYGTPEKISTDGGPQFTSQPFEQFLKNWAIQHRLSSVHYLESNGQAELAVKSSKLIIYDNTNPDGSLNTDKAERAILQHRFIISWETIFLPIPNTISYIKTGLLLVRN